MEPSEALEMLRKRKSLLLNFRWLLFLWLSATLAVQGNGAGSVGNLPLGLLGLMLASQLVLWRLAPRRMEGLKVYYTVFLFDLMVILLNLQATGQVHQDLVIAFFSGIFIAALTRRVGATFLSALLVGGIYMALRYRVTGLATFESGQMLNLPFLLIASIHSGLVAQEAESESDAKRRLQADHGALSRRFKNTFFEAARFNHDIKSLLNTLPFGMVMLDRSNGVRMFNATAELAFGIPSKCVLGSLISQIPELASLQDALERQKTSWDGAFQRLEVQLPEGYPLQMILSSYSVGPDNGEPVGTLLILMPVPYHQAVAEFAESVPLDDRMPARPQMPPLPKMPAPPQLPGLAQMLAKPETPARIIPLDSMLGSVTG